MTLASAGTSASFAVKALILAMPVMLHSAASSRPSIFGA